MPEAEREWWHPVLADHAYFERLRSDYPEAASLSDAELIEEYADGNKYVVLWDDLGDAYEEYEKLVDSWRDLLEACEAAVVDAARAVSPSARLPNYEQMIAAIAKATPKHNEPED